MKTKAEILEILKDFKALKPEAQADQLEFYATRIEALRPDSSGVSEGGITPLLEQYKHAVWGGVLEHDLIHVIIDYVNSHLPPKAEPPLSRDKVIDLDEMAKNHSDNLKKLYPKMSSSHYTNALLNFKAGAEAICSLTPVQSEDDYMTKRSIIRGFVRWQLEKAFVDPLTIDYEVAEMYLDSDPVQSEVSEECPKCKELREALTAAGNDRSKDHVFESMRDLSNIDMNAPYKAASKSHPTPKDAHTTEQIRDQELVDTCINCDEQKQTHHICGDCLNTIINENKQRVKPAQAETISEGRIKEVWEKYNRVYEGYHWFGYEEFEAALKELGIKTK